VDGTILQVNPLGQDVEVKVSFNGTVCNPGPSQIENLAARDYTAGGASAAVTLASTTLSPCTTPDGSGGCSQPLSACTTFTGSYVPTTIDGTAPLGRYFFKDEVVLTNAKGDISTLITAPCNNVMEGVLSAYGCSGVAKNPVNGQATGCPMCNNGQCVSGQ
jgi:hypothetical protein